MSKVDDARVKADVGTHSKRFRRPGPMIRGFGGVLLALVCFGALQAVKTSSSSMPAASPAESDTPVLVMNVAPTSARPSGSFLSAEFPADVEYSKDVRKTVVGDIEQSSASAKVGDASLSITASILPGFVVAVATDDILYRKARNELLKTFSAESTSWKDCTHAGFACRKLLYEADDGRKGMARLYLHDGVLVVVNAIYDENEGTARRFLASAHANDT